ncbi:MAG TPA: hypothetical protein VMT86_17525 [Bryobacteraceae bacterium]|nr:hypothetical protein [Bryobacteraceae bacterium]
MIQGDSLAITVNVPGGLLASENIERYERFETAGLRRLTGREEDWLANHRGRPGAIVASALLDACLVEVDGRAAPNDAARRLLAGDRDYLVLQLRRLTMGDAIHAVAACPECGAKMDVNFDIASIPVDWRQGGPALHSMALEGGRTVRFRLPTGADQESVAALSLEEAAAELFDRCVEEAGALSGAEQDAVIDAMEKVAPGVNLELDLACPECSKSFLLPFDTTSFFFDEMRIPGDRLLREVHALALYYHWSESDILGMERSRRRRYLALLRDATRED